MKVKHALIMNSDVLMENVYPEVTDVMAKTIAKMEAMKQRNVPTMENPFQTVEIVILHPKKKTFFAVSVALVSI